MKVGIEHGTYTAMLRIQFQNDCMFQKLNMDSSQNVSKYNFARFEHEADFG